MVRIFWIAFFCAIVVNCQSFVDYVDTRIGSGSSDEQAGNTFPATGVPFANMYMTPQTQAHESKCIAPYYSWDTTISGFRASHWVSGSCMKDYGSVTVMPFTSLPTNTSEAAYASPFDLDSERSAPHLYSVLLTRDNISVDITATSHCGLVRLVYPPSATSRILVLKPNSDWGEGEVSIDITSSTVTLRNPAHRLYAGNGLPAGFAGNAVIRLPENSIVGCGVFDGDLIRTDVCEIKASGQSVAGFIELALPSHSGSGRNNLNDDDGSIIVTICNSFTNLTMAALNMKSEILEPNLSFSQIASNAYEAWDTLLSSVTLEGASTDMSTMFYTAMYHTLLHPRNFGDVNANEHVRFASNGTENEVVTSPSLYFDDFSMWDTFRVVQPWISIVSPARFTAMTRSLLLKYRDGGWLPIFPCWNSYTSEMIGDHAIVVLSDAIAKGLFPDTDGFTAEEVYEAGMKNAFSSPSQWEKDDGRGRRAGDAYFQYGYVPIDVDTGKDQQVSISLEYAYDDFVLGQLACRLNHTKECQVLKSRSESWRKLMDNSTGEWYVRGKFSNGSFVSPFDPFAGPPFHGSHPTYMTEASAFEYTWFVPQNVPGLVSLFGGPMRFSDKLNYFLSGGFYDVGNEPDIQAPYLFNFAGTPWNTQYWIRNLTTTHYHPTPSGLPGNDDAGAMSAWFLFSVVGFYPVCQGGGPTYGPKYILGAPQVPKLTITVADGVTLAIEAQGLSDTNMYIQSSTLNGERFSRGWISHAELVKGGKWEFVMGSTPNYAWGSSPDDIPTEC
jgi:predicted alpha-1,2-mannosidase